MSIADVIPMPRFMGRAAPRMIESKAVHIEDVETVDTKVAHVKQLHAIWQRAEQVAEERRLSMKEAVEAAAERKRDYEEARDELTAELRAEGAIL